MEEMSSTEIGSISPHVASLTKSFALVPPAAVPAIIDCVLASSSLSLSKLFSSLLHASSDLFEALQSNYIVSYITAICHLIEKTQASSDALRLSIWRVFVPLLKATNPNDHELFSQIEGLLCDIVSKIQSWELMEATLVPYCLRSVGLCVGMVHNDESAVYQWSSEVSFDGDCGTLPLSVACRVLTLLLETALRSQRDGFSSSECFVQSLIWDLSNLALGMLAHCSEYRSCAIRLLLPFIIRALDAVASVKISVNGLPYTLSRLSFSRKVWKCCSSLFSLGHLERLDAYSILSLYFSLSYHTEGCKNVSEGDSGEERFDIEEEKEFWEEIRKGLVDKDPSVRKQSLHILKTLVSHSASSFRSEFGQCCSGVSEFVIDAENDQTISHDEITSHVGMTKKDKWADKEAKSLGVGKVCHVGNHCLSGLERWKVFLLLYEMLEEYGTHLVEAAWTHQISLLFPPKRLNSFMNPITTGVYHAQMETSEGIFSWLAVLWERGFFHGNPQVRCLIMQSFLGIDWSIHGSCAGEVPKSFVLGSFILGLNDVVHHKEFGVKGVYTSKTIQGATKYLCEFSRHLSLSKRVAFICSLASIARQESFGRAGLMALAFCIASAACESEMLSEAEVLQCEGSCVEVNQVISVEENHLPSTADLLGVLGIVIERSKQHFNQNYRLQVCEQVLKAASSVINTSDVQLDVLLHFLSTVPREFTDVAGKLRGIVQLWLAQIGNKCCSFSSADTEMQVLKMLIGFPLKFIKHQPSPDAFVSFNDEDVEAWRVEAQRWARMFFLVITEEQHLEPIFMFLQSYGSRICKQDNNLDCIPSKFLILVLSLVEELEIGWKKITCYTEAVAKTELAMTDMLDQSSPLEAYMVYIKFTRQFLLLLEELVCFAKSVSPIFWSIPMEKDVILPCSVKGKLGGPTQRRLACRTTSAVLQAILSMKTVAYVSSWCIKPERDNCLDPLFTFLWDFSWKVIQSPTYDSEAGAEIRLASYEALAPVLKALSTAFSSFGCDFITAYNKSILQNGEDIPLLDPLVLSFLGSINNLLAVGVLTRSRRAILMNWKWLCVDSLLSIPHEVIEKGVHLSSYPFFSDSTLRSTFIDIVESLENAGESSVLSMLRSVRLVLGLLCSGRTSQIISPCSGVNCQMILQLVHSSWVLHLSCNKRRVAPIAALLSAVLHQSVFNDLSMHEMNGNKQGPLKWFIEKVLDEGIKSPRTIRLAALHLTGLWLLYPRTVKYYIKELKLLSLYGSVAFDEDFEAELSENHESRTEVLLLSQSPDHELTEVFINTEMYARVSVAVLFDKLASLANRRGERENDDSQAALDCGKMFLLELLDSVVNDKDLAKELYKKYSSVHRRKVRAWQMICILSRFVDKDIVEEVTANLHICLYRNNLPAVRQYLETFATQIYLKFPSLAEEQLIPIFYNYNMRPQALSSYVFIATNVILHASELPVQIKHLHELLPPVIPLLTSHHHSLRGFAQLLVYHVLSKLLPALKPNSSEVVSLEKKCFEDLKSYLAENIDCVRLRASMGSFLDAFDAKTSATPIGIFNARKEGSEFECVPMSLMEKVITFLDDVRDDLRYSMAKDAVTIKKESLAVGDACKDMEGSSLNANEERVPPQALQDLSLDFQKKVTFHKHVRQPVYTNTDCILGNAESPRLLLEMEKEDQLLNPVVQSRNQAMDRIRASQQQFILMASLLDRIPNLAGLARTCEVFKAAGMTIADASIMQDKQFQLISVTAEKWVPIIEVPVRSMKVFLEKKRREGFSILGLEQTANSTSLDQYTFPNKTVLVLGREKEGIPVDIIHALDACIEIPQLGIIRSLNVHVSGAIALWEYTRQQRSKQP